MNQSRPRTVAGKPSMTVDAAAAEVGGVGRRTPVRAVVSEYRVGEQM
jgi:hypothetical protein